MGICINMEMPKNQAFAVINSNGLVEILDDKNTLICECFAVSVPPHGRLIDAEELRQDWLENGENEYVYDTNSFLYSIDDAPTVIEAEEGE